MKFIPLVLLAASAAVSHAKPQPEADLLIIDNGTAEIGIDRAKGATITHLSWKSYAKNAVNSHDPGRLIQQSYYAGKRLDRSSDGQHKAWSPWSWNPIQGGGVGSWARVNKFERADKKTLFGETVPKLWDMPNEEAAALMRQWTSFEPGMPNVITVRCEFVSTRDSNDRWGPTSKNHQEIPATYFTRNFDTFRSYLGEGKWREETAKAGPPWSKAKSSRKAMACFVKDGQGIAIFSPDAEFWNFGPHADGKTDDPLAGPCVHIAPITSVELGPRSTLRYRYWLVVGKESQISQRLDALWEKYSDDRVEVTNP